jgi:hypothetical protein
MRLLSTERLELIDALVAEANIGGVTAGLLEKDEHLTAALRAVFELNFEHASLVFCGGTSLSKAHSLIERMSEDAGNKVVLFLSCLCGSELKESNDQNKPEFLSCLRGSELRCFSFIKIMSFLSCLRGSERLFKFFWCIYQFLSCLRGSEHHDAAV